MKVVTLQAEQELADDLQRLVDQLRSGALVADAAVVVLRNGRDQMMHRPMRLGRAMSTTETMGMLGYGSCHLYHDANSEGQS